MSKSKQTISKLSPAKVNLMLRVLGQRDDGYHDLQTCFELLNWGDQMYFSPSDSNDLTIEGNFQGLAAQDNLIDKAYRLLMPFAHESTHLGLHIHVEKRIPQGSGLGGGSSNAAQTLKVLNELWQCGLSLHELMELGLVLGADVPIFLLGHSACATGVGEQLIPMQFSPNYYLLFFPDCSISTGLVFSDPNLKRNQIKVSSQQMSQPEYWINDCLPVVLNNFPNIKSLYEKILKVCPVYMSGTGSTLFACFSTLEAAQSCLNKCSHLNCEMHIVVKYTDSD